MADNGKSSLSGTIVFTGTLSVPRKEAEQKAKAAGLSVSGTVTKNATFVVCGDKAGQKKAQAEKLGVKVLTESEWENMLSGATKGKRKKDEKLEERPSKKTRINNNDNNEKSSSSSSRNSALAQPAPSQSRPPALSRDGSIDIGVLPASGSFIDISEEDLAEPIQESSKEETSLTEITNKDGKKTAPKRFFADGETLDVTSQSSNTQYRIKRTGDHYFCTCPAWRNQGGNPVNLRTCKHLKEVLGEEYENARCGSYSVARRAKSAPNKLDVNPLLAHKWNPEKDDPLGWWISEKLDGVRAWWDGPRGKFFSRIGNVFEAPEWFLKGMPRDVVLDGELWGGRGVFQSTVGIVKTAGSPRWKDITYQIFDIPTHENKPFEERVEIISKLLDKHKPLYASLVAHTACTSIKHLNDTLAKIESLGGEGLMIRKPKSTYIHGRSNTLLKIKTFHDGDAVVIGYEPGKGKYTGHTGALKCKMKCGKEFKCASGMSDAERMKPPKIGSIISYKCQELTQDGVPRFPIFLCVAIDKKVPSDPKCEASADNDK